VSAKVACLCGLAGFLAKYVPVFLTGNYEYGTLISRGGKSFRKERDCAPG
jgi:hypothetical protein